MKLITAAIAISTLASSQAASTSSSGAVSETKRLRNIQVYKSEKNDPAFRGGQPFNDGRVLQFLGVSISLSLSVDFSLPETTAPSSAIVTTDAPSSSIISTLTPTTLAPSAAPSMITSVAKGGATMAPVSSAPSTAAPFATVIETPIVVSSPPSSASPVSSAPSTSAPVASSSSTTCTFCVGYGINSDFVITGSDVTCGQVLEYAPTVLTGSNECTNVQLAEAVCCTLDMPSNLVDNSMSYDMSYSTEPTMTTIADGTMAPTPASSGKPTFPATPSQPPVGLLPASPRNSAMMMSAMGGATCLIYTLVAIAGLF